MKKIGITLDSDGELVSVYECERCRYRTKRLTEIKNHRCKEDKEKWNN